MSDENNIPLRQEMFCSPLSVLSRFCHNSPQKRLRNFLRGDIMRKLWGRGSGGRAMRSQRIGQGFESPRLHQKTARTSCLCSFLLSRGDSAAHSLRRPALRAEPLLPVRADALLRPTRLRAQIKWRKTAIPSLRSLRVPSSPPKNAAKTQCLCRVFFSWRRIGERTCVLACIFVMTTAPAQYRCLHPLCAGSAACAARRFRLDETFFQCLHRDIYGTLPSLRTYGEAPLVFIVARGLCGAQLPPPRATR